MDAGLKVGAPLGHVLLHTLSIHVGAGIGSRGLSASDRRFAIARVRELSAVARPIAEREPEGSQDKRLPTESV